MEGKGGGRGQRSDSLAEKCFCEQKNCTVVKENIVVGWMGVGVPKRPDLLKPKSGTESGMFQGVDGSKQVVYFQAVLR